MSSTPRERVDQHRGAACGRKPQERSAGRSGLDGESRRPARAQAAPASDASESLLRTNDPTLPCAADATTRDPTPLRIGSYRILGVVGEGSSGIVYQAQQDNPHRSVALKLLKAGEASTGALRRLEQEAQMLGRLQHPGIAQIFEAGTTDGEHGCQPFFAMELIRGVPLTEYADVHALSTRKRLALMIKVCEAVQHAHQKGVIHRDLKPGNILVDELGQPKILDFGIALTTDPQTAPGALRTSRKELTGTVPYMSLEQVEGRADDLDTRTDVYALGVIVFELLTGRLPFDFRHKTISDAARIIAAQEPRRVSEFNRAFRGDLDAIVGRALERDKTQRYQSSSDLAADLRRYLSFHPVSAHPAGAWYLLVKFAKRRKALVGGMVAAFAATLIAIIGIDAARSDAVAARNEAQGEANNTKAAYEFLEEILSTADPFEAIGADVTVRQALDAAASRIKEKWWASEPGIEVAVRTTMGKTYCALGLYDEAEQHLVPAEDIGRRLLGDDHHLTLRATTELGFLLLEQGELGEAETRLQRALTAQRRLLGLEHQDTLETQSYLAILRRRQGRLSDAQMLYERALAADYSVYGPEHRNTLITLNNLGRLMLDQGKPAEAERRFRTTLAVQRRVLRAGHPDALATMQNLAYALRQQGELTEAEELYNEALALKRDALGDDHPSTLKTMHNLAWLLETVGRLAEAERMYRKTVEGRRTRLGDHHSHTLASLLRLGELLETRGDSAGAEALYRDMARRARDGLSGGDPRLADALIRWGMFLTDHEDPANAEPLLRECLAIRTAGFPRGDWRIANTESALGACLTKLRRFAEAERLLLGSYAVYRAEWGEADAFTRRGLNRIIQLYDAWGKLDKAADFRALQTKASESPDSSES